MLRFLSLLARRLCPGVGSLQQILFWVSQGAVQVKLELGHRAQVRKKPTAEGFTHDWMVFVRGPEQSNIQHFVEKVVFHLHESFPRPKRGRWRDYSLCVNCKLFWWLKGAVILISESETRCQPQSGRCLARIILDGTHAPCPTSVSLVWLKLT